MHRKGKINMARKYDIVARLRAKNEKPFVMIDENHTYTINTSKTNVMAIMALYDEYEKKDSNKENMELIDKVIKTALGEAALNYINESNMTFEAVELIIEAIMAGISGSEIEDIEKKTQEKK